MPVPALNILHETIRNLYFHVTMWFTMMVIFLVSFIYSIKYLNKAERNYDIIACEAANIGILFGTLGLITGSIWAKFTWGEFWSNDPKELCALIAWLISKIVSSWRRTSSSRLYRWSASTTGAICTRYGRAVCCQSRSRMVDPTTRSTSE